MKEMELAGRPFPNISLPDLNGISSPVLGTAGSWTLIAVGHSDCGTTRLLAPFLQRMHERKGPGSSVVLVLQDDAATARALLQELVLDLPVRLESEPYPLSSELDLETVPTLVLVGAGGVIDHGSEGFERAAVEDLALRLGAGTPFFVPEDKAPALRPG